VNKKWSEHILHLHSPKIDKHTIQKPFLFLSDDNEDAIYVTRSSLNRQTSGTMSASVNPKIIDFEQVMRLKDSTERLRIVLDASSIPGKNGFNEKSFNLALRLEGFINELSAKRPTKCLCTYDLALLKPKMIQLLANHHNQLLLTTNDITVLSGSPVDRSELPKDSIEEIVKNNLEAIVLALLQKRPMCGMEIMETIHREFNVFLSPAFVYPLLRTLNDRRLVRFEVIGKTKRYLPANEKAEKEIQNILNEHIQVSKFLNWYLKHNSIDPGGVPR